MDNLEENLLYSEETHNIIGCAFEVYNTLGSGFLEEVYQEALELEFSEHEIPYLHKPNLKIYYKEHLLKNYYQPDLLCFENTILIELKAISSLTNADERQLINYLKGTRIEVGLLINFGKKGKLEWKRMVYSDKKYIRKVAVDQDKLLGNRKR